MSWMLLGLNSEISHLHQATWLHLQSRSFASSVGRCVCVAPTCFTWEMGKRRCIQGEVSAQLVRSWTPFTRGAARLASFHHRQRGHWPTVNALYLGRRKQGLGLGGVSGGFAFPWCWIRLTTRGVLCNAYLIFGFTRTSSLLFRWLSPRIWCRWVKRRLVSFIDCGELRGTWLNDSIYRHRSITSVRTFLRFHHERFWLSVISRPVGHWVNC